MLTAPSIMHIRRAVEPVESITAAEILRRAHAARLRMGKRPSTPVVRLRPPAFLYEDDFGPKKPRYIPEPDAPAVTEFGAVKRDWLLLSSPFRVTLIMDAVCHVAGVRKIDLFSQRRTLDVMLPRQVAMYLARHLTGRSLPDIGARMGGRDHTTILHGVEKVGALLAAGDPRTVELVSAVKTLLGVKE